MSCQDGRCCKCGSYGWNYTYTYSNDEARVAALEQRVAALEAFRTRVIVNAELFLEKEPEA